ncbi:MAG: SDR family NAD(P)-dependent oxidoreductase [Acidimicrobiia bacterium]
MRLDGSTALVTGGASGLGAACATRLASAGAHVVIADLAYEAGRNHANEINGSFSRTDVTSEEDVERAVAMAMSRGPLRAVVNAAGVGSAGRTIDRAGNPHSLEEFARVVTINLIGTFNCVRLAAAAMASTEPVDEDGQRGAIVNISSVAAFDGQIGQAAYSASKGGIVGLTLPLARDLSAVGIRVNTIAPGLIDTPIYGEGEASEAFKAQLGKSVLFPKRLGTSDEVASLVHELVVNNYMNGEVIRLDGAIRMPPK